MHAFSAPSRLQPRRRKNPRTLRSAHARRKGEGEARGRRRSAECLPALRALQPPEASVTDAFQHVST
eukprot:CAMPEP_0175482102 /NCGR_PEP_ID=MMETSP0095-20121207/78784_1 /TAXON_ID=311494 /ORGANISM="Alexandrium monilatum, Strain CCMP3105" /LENGTH=66 /DNA_ID=CAMNT_0016783739 /DNA_START=1 /DNA_END=197 /DNA_ORIENTATION=+